jgi:hypothetical protein
MKGKLTLNDNWQENLDKPDDPNYKGVSAIFSKFAEPLFKEASNLKEIEICCQIAAIAWNLAMVPDLRQASLREMMQADSDEMNIFIHKQISIMIERKEKQFRQYDWLVGDYHVEDNGDSYRIAVAACKPDMGDLPNTK